MISISQAVGLLLTFAGGATFANGVFDREMGRMVTGVFCFVFGFIFLNGMTDVWRIIGLLLAPIGGWIFAMGLRMIHAKNSDGFDIMVVGIIATILSAMMVIK